MSADLIAPCPFCKGIAAVGGIRDGQQVRCHSCRAAGPPVYHGPKGWPACTEDAITAWNTRAADRLEGKGSGALSVGWKLVPVEPTEEMIAAATGEIENAALGALWPKMMAEAYGLMTAAAPPSPRPGREEVAMVLGHNLGLGWAGTHKQLCLSVADQIIALLFPTPEKSNG